MSKFLKSFLLLVTAGLFTATSWAAESEIGSVGVLIDENSSESTIEIPTPTYGSTFSDNVNSDKVSSEGGFSLEGNALSFITVSGSNKAWDVSGDTWGSQTILTSNSSPFTLSATAKLGTTANGVLFSFVNNNTNKQGLVVRRGEDAHTVVVTKGGNSTSIISAFVPNCDVNYYNYTLVAANNKLSLYVNGLLARNKEGNIVEAADATIAELIPGDKFQPGRRFGGVVSGESNGNGAIDELTAWNNEALTAEQVKVFVESVCFTALVGQGQTTYSHVADEIANATNAPLVVDFGGTSGKSFTFDNEDSLNLTSITTMGVNGGTIAKTGAGSLTVANTIIGANTTIDANVGNFGAVTIANGKTLFAQHNTTALPFTSVSGNNGTLVLSGTSTSKNWVNIDCLKNTLFGGQLILRDKTWGQFTQVSVRQFPHMLVDEGKASVSFYGNGDNENVEDADGAETIRVVNGAELDVYLRDFGGWNGYSGKNLKVYVGGENSTLKLETYASAYPGCFTGQVIIDDGGKVIGTDNSGASLHFYGDPSADTTVPEVLMKSGTGTWSGFLWKNKGITIGVNDNATLNFEAVLKGNNGASLTKIGGGTLKITAAQTNHTGATTINGGTLYLAESASLASDSAVTIASNAILAGTGTINGTLTFNTGATIDVTDGAITASGTVELPADGTVTVSGTLVGGNYILKTTSASDDGAAKFVADGYEVVADNVGYKVVKVVRLGAGDTYTVAKPLEYTKIVAEGAITINIADITLDQATVAPYLNVTGVTSDDVTYTTAYETCNYIVGEETYPWIFRGTEDANWANPRNWYVGYRKMDEDIYWLPQSGEVIPGAENSNEWSATLFDGSLMNVVEGVDGYKTITLPESTKYEGWASNITVCNGAHVVIGYAKKHQSNNESGPGNWRVDDTSKITVLKYGNGSGNGVKHFYVNAPEGILFAEGTVAGFSEVQFHFDGDGSVTYATLNNLQTIAELLLDLGDSSLSGRKLIVRKLIGFTGGNASFTVANGAVTTTNDAVTPTMTDTLQEVGQYKFEQRNDGYYVVYMAYAETVELTEFTATVDEDGTTLSEALNGAVLSTNAALTIDFGGASGQVFTFDNEEALDLASITITGVNGGTIALGQTCAGVAYGALTLNTTVSADAAFYATNTGAIDGTGKLCLASGELTLAKANTYTGGTDIAAGATLVMGNANAIGTTGAITGAGTLKFSGLVPTNLSGLTTGTAASDATPASGWTGTFYMMNRASVGQFPVNDWGNANSTVCLESCSGYLAPSTGVTIVPNIRLEGYGWRSQNGDQNGGQFIFTGALSGSGKLEVAGDPEAGNFYKFTGNVSGFTGYVNVEGNHRVVFGNADSQGNGKITIATDVTIAANQTWTAVNGIVITENGTLTISEARALPTNKTVSGAGALVINGTMDLSGITGALTCALTAADGATVTVTEAQLAAFAKVTIPETATLIVKANRSMSDHLTGCTYDITAGAGSTIDGDIVVEGMANASGKFAEGKLTIDVPKNPTLTGSAWWWDYEFNNNSLANDGFADNTALSNSDNILPGNQAFTTADENGNQMLKLPARPWRDVAEWPTEATFVMYTKAGSTANGMLVSFGSSQGNGKSITLMTGENPAQGDMRLVYATGTDNNSVVDLVKNLSLPNVTASYHLYAFVLRTVGGKTNINVYVDGNEVAKYEADTLIQLGGGFQIASVHGNGPSDLKRLANDDTATMDFLRVSNTVLSAEAMKALAEAYPYTSPDGIASRTVAQADAVKTWIGAEDELVWAQETLNAEGGKVTTNKAAPTPATDASAGSVVKVIVTDETSLSLNIPVTGVSYEALEISETDAGEGVLTLTAVQDAGQMTISGKTSIKTNVIIAANAVKIGAVDVAAEKTLTFDYSEYDFSDIWATTSIPLTGYASGNGTIAVKFPAEKPAQITTWECVKDSHSDTYAIVVTVDLSTLTGTVSGDACAWDDIVWKIGETSITLPEDFSRLTTIPLAVDGDAATLALSEALTLNAVTVSGGTLTLAGAELTVASLTLDNADVMATTTLRASAVTGTKGTERLTMTLGEGEYTRAMALSNCAFTKAGAGTLKLGVDGTEMNDVEVTLAGGMLSLEIQGGVDPKIENVTFIYVDANEDGTADGELTNWGWVHSESSVTFDVPAGVTGKAFVASNSNLTGACAVVKQGAGALELGIKTTPYTGATTISGGTLSYHASDVCTVQGAISVAAGAAIKGSARCTLASLSFANGAVIDATDAPVVATDVTLPAEDGTVTVRMTSHGEVLKTTGLDDVTKFAVETPVANCSLVVTENGLAYVAAPATGDVEFSAEVQELIDYIAQAAASEGVTSLTIEGITLAMDGEGNPVKADIEGLEVFESVTVLVVPDGENGTGVAMVNYVFGISDITVNGDGKIEVKASVDCLAMDNPVEPIEGEDAGEGEVEMPELPRPTFVNGVTVELLNGEDVIGDAVVDLENMANASVITITSDDTVADIFGEGKVGTLDLTVKVKTQSAE